MSEENLDLHLRALDAFSRRDLDAFLEFCDEAIETESRLVAIEGIYRGHDGVRRWWRNLSEFFSDYRVEVEEANDLDDVSLVYFRADAHGAASDTPLIESIWQAARWRGGKCVWWRNFSTEAEAVEAVGFEQPDRS